MDGWKDGWIRRCKSRYISNILTVEEPYCKLMLQFISELQIGSHSKSVVGGWIERELLNIMNYGFWLILTSSFLIL